MAKLEEMKEKVQRQREQIDLLKSQVENLLQNQPVPPVVPENEVTVEVEDSKAIELMKPGLKRSFTLMEHKLHVAFYEFNQSMWDASLLLCFHRTSCVDKVLLLVGVLINLTLQVALLLVVSMNMLENPFPDTKVQEMISWRVSNGHTEFDESTGKSKIARLCNRELWSYEQDQYDEMYEYLYMPVPGVILSGLAIVLWVLTIMVEYRHCLEQYLGVYHLPSLDAKEEFEEINEDGEIVIKGIPWYYRYIALLCLCLPRLFVMGFLGVIGCQYLAQTSSLSDIVLNAVALAFVLEVDELVANVLLTEKLRGLLPKIKPISCGTTSHNFTPVKDLVRYTLTTGLIAFSFSYWLVPFSNNVEAAAMALCGGYQEFSFTGGTAADPSIVLRPREYGTDEWVAECSEENSETYFAKYYVASGKNSSNSTAPPKSSVDWEARRQKHVLEFAFNTFFAPSCAAGEMLQPQSENGDRPCIPIPASLKRTLPQEVTPGLESAAIPPNCPRLNVSRDCSAPALGERCVWSWLSAKCDGIQPLGSLWDQGCGENTAYEQKCSVFVGSFETPHPVVNCKAWELCGLAGCVGVTGMLNFYINDFQYLPDWSKEEGFLNILTTMFKSISGGLLDSQVVYRRLQATSDASTYSSNPAGFRVIFPSSLSTATSMQDLIDYYQYAGWNSSVPLQLEFWYPTLASNFFLAKFLAVLDAENFTRDFNAEWLKYDNSSNLTIVSSNFFDTKVLTNEEYDSIRLAESQSSDPGGSGPSGPFGDGPGGYGPGGDGDGYGGGGLGYGLGGGPGGGYGDGDGDGDGDGGSAPPPGDTLPPPP